MLSIAGSWEGIDQRQKRKIENHCKEKHHGKKGKCVVWGKNSTTKNIHIRSQKSKHGGDTAYHLHLYMHAILGNDVIVKEACITNDAHELHNH